MAGTHLRWHKRSFRAHWDLRGAPGCSGEIAATGSPGPTAYTWSARRAAPDYAAGDPDAAGVAASFPEARLLASRAAIALLRAPLEQPVGGPVPAERPVGALVVSR
jgi:hypothetical protein